MLRRKGQKSVQCDLCETIFDDRPRDRDKDVEQAAVQAGWVAAGEADHYCPACKGNWVADAVDGLLSEVTHTTSLAQAQMRAHQARQIILDSGLRVPFLKRKSPCPSPD